MWTGGRLPAIFALLQAGGGIAPEEMARTFNCGIGMAAIVSPKPRPMRSPERSKRPGKTVIWIGRIEEGQRGCTVSGNAGTLERARGLVRHP